MDGFLDTCDARASYGDREKKLSILKDSHVGAFAVIYGGVWLILFFAACAEMTADVLPVIAAGFTLSRALSGLSAAVFPEARKQGMLADFMRNTDRRKTAAVMVCGILAAGLFMAAWDLVSAAYAVTAAFLIFFYYRYVAIHEFGGVTGDLAGYFLQLCELSMIFTVVLGNGGMR